MNNVYLLLELARWDRSGRVLQTLMCASKPLYLYLKQNKNVCAALRDSWLTVKKTSTSTRYYDWDWRLHRLDGPASIDDCGEIWFCRGAPHRADGPAHSLTNTWVHHGLVLYTDQPVDVRQRYWADAFYDPDLLVSGRIFLASMYESQDGYTFRFDSDGPDGYLMQQSFTTIPAQAALRTIVFVTS
jgi:hypothetical protein